AGVPDVELRPEYVLCHACRSYRIRRRHRADRASVTRPCRAAELRTSMYDERVFQRKTTGSVVCPSCGSLVGVRDDKCYTCGRANPGLWGFGPALRTLGADFGFAPVVIGASATIYVLTLLLSGSAIRMEGIMGLLAPSTPVLFLFGASGAIPVFTFGRWWTVLSAGWLHASLLHIALNMYWVRYIGPAMVDILGPARTIIVYVAAGVTGFALSSFA